MSRGLAPISLTLLELATAGPLARPETPEHPGRVQAREKLEKQWEEPPEPWAEAQAQAEEQRQAEPAKCPQAGCKRMPHRGPHRFVRRIDHANEISPTHVYRSIPLDYRLAPSRATFLDEVGNVVEQCDPRFRRSVISVATYLSNRAAWSSGRPTAFPGHAWLAQQAKCSPRTVQRVMRFLMGHELVVRLAEGRLARFRRDGGAKNEAAVYLLVTPVPPPTVDKSVYPREGTSLEKNPYTRTRAKQRDLRTVQTRSVRYFPAALLAGVPENWQTRGWIGKKARRWHRELVVEQLQWQVRALRHAPTRLVAASLREHLDAVEHGGTDWRQRDILHALDWAPDGTRWRRPPLDTAHYPAKAALARLHAWRDGDGKVLPSPTRQSSHRG